QELAEAAVGRVAAALEIDVLDAAAGILEVANVEMGRALRVIRARRGVDAREFALVAFGGAGPMHACALAEELGIGTVLVPRAGGVLSALGLAISDARRDDARPVLSALEDLDPARLRDAFEEMRAATAEELGAAAEH